MSIRDVAGDGSGPKGGRPYGDPKFLKLNPQRNAKKWPKSLALALVRAPKNVFLDFLPILNVFLPFSPFQPFLAIFNHFRHFSNSLFDLSTSLKFSKLFGKIENLFQIRLTMT